MLDTDHKCPRSKFVKVFLLLFFADNALKVQFVNNAEVIA